MAITQTEQAHFPLIAERAIRAERIFLFESQDDLLVASRPSSQSTARDIQSRLLPGRPPKVPGYHFDALSIPALEVGGDHFNFFSAGGDRLGILIADVSGKGMPAALLATLLRATFRTQSWGNHDVRDVLVRANDFLGRVLPPGTFITATYCILEMDSRRLNFARAGHEPLLLVNEHGEARSFAPAGLPLGVAPRSEFEALLDRESFIMSEGDRVFLYTDGLTEAMDQNRLEFGYASIIETICGAPGRELEAVREAVERHCGGELQHDDLTMISIAVDPHSQTA